MIEIPAKRHQRTTISYLNRDEIDALLDAPDRGTWLGRRDHAMLLTAIQTGVRVSELVNLVIANLTLGTGAHIRVTGKGRKERATTADHETATSSTRGCDERNGRAGRASVPDPPGGRLTPRAFAGLLDKHTVTASHALPVAADQARDSAYPAPHQRDAAPSRERRHLHDRALARA